MNRAALDYLIRRADSRRDRRDYEDGRRGRSGRFVRDRRDYEDGRRDYEDGRRDYEDGRRGRNGRFMRDSRDYHERGNIDFEGTMDFDDRDYDDRDMRDYGDTLKLSKADIQQWKQMLKNEDGTHGAHYEMSQIMDIADKHNVRFKEFDEKDLCMTVNMLYSDYCEVVKRYVSPDKELTFFVEMAIAFLCDRDGPEASEKLALYYNCIVDA